MASNPTTSRSSAPVIMTMTCGRITTVPTSGKEAGEWLRLYILQPFINYGVSQLLPPTISTKYMTTPVGGLPTAGTAI